MKKELIRKDLGNFLYDNNNNNIQKTKIIKIIN